MSIKKEKAAISAGTEITANKNCIRKPSYQRTKPSSNKKRISLRVFLRGSTKPEDKMPGCSNYDNHYSGCIYADTCAVEDGRRCRRFEKAVLPTAADIGMFEDMQAKYAKQVGLEFVDNTKIRRCPDCGDELPPRKRYCSNCVRRRRLKAYRNGRAKRNS